MSEVAVGGKDLAATLGYESTAPTIDDLASLVHQCSANSGVTVTAELAGYYTNAAEIAFSVQRLARAGASRVIASPKPDLMEDFIKSCAANGVSASVKLGSDCAEACSALLAANPAVEVIKDSADGEALILRCDTAERVTCSAAAARSKLPSSITVAKALSWAESSCMGG